MNGFLTYLAVERRASASTQGQARAALLFLYREVLHRPLEGVGSDIVRGKRPRRLPAVLTRKEIGRVLRQIEGTPQLVASILYGSGLRLREGLQLRVKDLDLERRELSIREGKGGRDRISVLPGALVPQLTDQIERRRVLHDRDLASGCGRAEPVNASETLLGIN